MYTYTYIYIYIYIYTHTCLAPPNKKHTPFQYSYLSRVQPSNSFVDAILSFCRRERWDIALHCIALHCIALHCITLQSGGTDLAWIMRGSARAVPPGLGESRPGLDSVEGLEVSTRRCDEQGGGTTLHCDVLVGPCIREQTNHLEVSTLRIDEQVSGTTLHCDVFSGPCIRKQTDHLEVSTLRCDGQGGGITLHCDILVCSCIRDQTDHLEVSTLRCDERGRHHPALRCLCLPLHQRENRSPRGALAEMR